MGSLYQLTPAQWLLAALAALCVGLSKGGFGGVGMLTVLFMAEILPARESTGAVLPLLVCGDVLAVAAFHRHALWRHIVRILPPALLGVVLGYFLMQRISNEVFRPLMGAIVFSMVVLEYLRRLRPHFFQKAPHARWFAWLMGGWSGVATMMANAAGPVMTLYLLAVGLPKFQFVGTSAWFFFIVNLFKIPFSFKLGLINGFSLAFNLVLIPLVLVGIALGRRLVEVIPQAVFDQLLLLFALLASVRLMWWA